MQNKREDDLVAFLSSTLRSSTVALELKGLKAKMAVLCQSSKAFCRKVSAVFAVRRGIVDSVFEEFPKLWDVHEIM